MFKILYLMKRKPGITHDEFVEYYQTKHSKLVEKAAPTAVKYFRKYLRPLTANESYYDKAGPNPNKQEFDVVMELWFENREAFDTLPGMNNPEIANVVMEDELNFIDVEAGVLRFTYDEVETDLGAIKTLRD